MTAYDTGELDEGPLGRLALSRSTVDRATQRRGDAAWIEAAWADPGTRVLVVHDSQALVVTRDGQLELVFVPPEQAPEGTRFLLGVDDAGVAYFGVSGGGDGEPGNRSESSEARPMSLRQAGALLSDRDAGLLTHAVALANWHDTHTHCPQCGTPTVPAPAGHLTTCPADGTEHFPRLDPAVIMLVLDPEDRLLLARNALWPAGRMSVVAGFVEPGESAEHAVIREVYEETAIEVGQVRYLGSQPWPMPRSLMLGFQSVAKGGQRITVDAEEIGEARWFSRAELLTAIETGELGAGADLVDRAAAHRVLVRRGAAGRSGGLAAPRQVAAVTAFSPRLRHDFLTKPTNLLEYSSEGYTRRRWQGWCGSVRGRQAAPRRTPMPAPERRHRRSRRRRAPAADGTLLAVVPIPGTGTSLAIVGYPVAMPGGGIATGPATAVTAAAVQAVALPALSAIAAGAPGDASKTGLLLDRDQRRVWADGREITLTFQEFELLAFLAAHPATVFTRADLVRQVWQRDFAADSRTVDVHVSRLRHKLGPLRQVPRHRIPRRLPVPALTTRP